MPFRTKANQIMLMYNESVDQLFHASFVLNGTATHVAAMLAMPYKSSTSSSWHVWHVNYIRLGMLGSLLKAGIPFRCCRSANAFEKAPFAMLCR